MARTQLRLDAMTGSMPDLKPASIAQGADAASFAAADVKDVLKGYAQAISNIHGITEFTAQVPGKFEHATSQFIGILSASSDIQGGADLQLRQDAFIGRNADVNGWIDVAGASDLHGKVKAYATAEVVGDLTGSADVLLNKAGLSKISTVGHMQLSPAGSKNLVADMGSMASEKVSFAFGGAEKAKVQAAGTWISGTLAVDGVATVGAAVALNLVGGDGALVFHDASKKLIDNSGLKYDAGVSALVAPKFQGTNLTPTRVVFVDANKNIIDDGDMTYDAAANQLKVANSVFGQDVSVDRDLTVKGNLLVQGDTVTVNVGELLIEDKIITVASGAAGATLDGAGIQLGLGADQTITWNHAGTKWIASSRMSAPVLQSNVASALFLSSSANGDIVAGTAADLVHGIKDQFAAGTGVHVGESAGVVTYSIGQAVETTSQVSFAGVTAFLSGSGLTSGRLLKASAGGLIVDANIDNFVNVSTGMTESLSGEVLTLSIGQSVDKSASPEFAGLKLTSYASKLLWSNAGVVEAKDLSYFVAGTANQVSVADDGDGTITLSLPYDISDASNTELVGFSATSILGALNELAAGSGGGKGKWAEMLATDAVSGEFTFASGPDWSAAGFDKARVDIYLNGQMMKETADYALSGARKVTFTFGLKADDVVTARIC